MDTTLSNLMLIIAQVFGVWLTVFVIVGLFLVLYLMITITRGLWYIRVILREMRRF